VTDPETDDSSVTGQQWLSKIKIPWHLVACMK